MSEDYKFLATIELSDHKRGKELTDLLKANGFSWVMDINRRAELDALKELKQLGLKK